MEGVIYFGPHTPDTASWSHSSFVSTSIDALNQLVAQINNCAYANVKSSSDWLTYNKGFKSFWDQLNEAFAGDQQLVGATVHRIYDGILNQCIDKGLLHDNVLENLQFNNPAGDKKEYFGALAQNHNWPEITDDLHVKSSATLHQLALKFLGEFPVSKESFTQRCKTIFPNLIFSDEFVDSLKKYKPRAGATTQGIMDFSIPVTHALNALNTIQVAGKSTETIMTEAQELSGFPCTPQGKNKSHLKIPYQDKTINCEFHLKISKNNHGTTGFYQRIHFGFYNDDGHKKILVSHSGKHL